MIKNDRIFLTIERLRIDFNRIKGDLLNYLINNKSDYAKIIENCKNISELRTECNSRLLDLNLTNYLVYLSLYTSNSEIEYKLKFMILNKYLNKNLSYRAINVLKKYSIYPNKISQLSIYKFTKDLKKKSLEDYEYLLQTLINKIMIMENINLYFDIEDDYFEDEDKRKIIMDL